MARRTCRVGMIGLSVDGDISAVNSTRITMIR